MGLGLGGLKTGEFLQEIGVLMASHSPHSSSRRPHKQLPLPVESTTKVCRRFASEPIEVYSRTSRGLVKKEREAVTDDTRVPVSAETAIIDSGNDAGDFQAHPQAQLSDVVTLPNRSLSQPVETSSTSVKPRKFAPQLIESTRRSRKSGDLGPTLSAHDRTDVSPGAQERSLPSHILFQPSQFPVLPDDGSLVVSADQTPQAPESRFSSSTLRKREPRRHSFRIPDLPSIQSSGDSEGSNESNCPSLSTSPSAASDETESSKHANETPKKGHENPSNRLLSLAAQAAQKHLREQAMAAYPNEQMHEPVDHFSVDREDDDDDDDDGEDPTDPGTLLNDTPRASQTESQMVRRDSTADWSMAEMRQHQEMLERQGKRQQVTIQPKIRSPCEVNGVMHTSIDLAPSRQQEDVTDTNYHGGRKGDGEMEKMRKAASPPMAGEDLRFPLCRSPRQTRLDVSQYPLGRRLPGTDATKRHSGLWAQGRNASQQKSTAGLWMGTSVKPAEAALVHPGPVRAGLLTPDTERDDLSTSHVSSEKDQLPSSPSGSQTDPKVSCLDAILAHEEQISLEFHDGFVTQVYNYLSLGYPSMAVKFDAELSKITRISIEELRRDDGNADAKGYLDAPDGRTGTEGVTCARWTALRMYVKEWARQQSHLEDAQEGANGEWGHRARKGSWAF